MKLHLDSEISQYITIHIFNRNSNKSILFVHGMFTGFGFWFRYLKYFKDFKLVFINIDFENIFTNSSFPNKLINYLKDFPCTSEVIIAHSYGSYLANFIGDDKVIRFNICPAELCKTISKERFIHYIKMKDSLEMDQISKIILSAKTFTQKLLEFSSSEVDSHTYLPISDIYFNYSKPFSPNSKISYFEGDHFQIEGALRSISLDLKKFNRL